MGLDIEEADYENEEISFLIRGYKDYPDIKFTQGWSGLHVFITELSDDDITTTSKQFLTDMQVLLIENIIKNTHTVTYKQIVAAVMPVDFHVIVLTALDVDTTGYRDIDAGSYKIAYKPEDIYTSGNITFVKGIPEDRLFVPLLYHAYAEVACDFLFNLMKAMTRLYHEADTIVEQVENAPDLQSLKDPLDRLDSVVKESSERYGKLRQILLNFKLKEQEYYSLPLDMEQKALADALGIPKAFKRLEADGSYMSVLWSEILEDRLRNIDATMDARVMLHSQEGSKKGWF